MKEITYKIVENLGYDAKDKKQTVIGEIPKPNMTYILNQKTQMS